MNREIKFRAKRADNGVLVYGNLFYWNRYGKNIPIIGEGVKNGSVNGYEINYETLGQFTGLTDKIGKYVFEGDILFDDYENNYWEVVYSANAFLLQNIKDKQRHKICANYFQYSISGNIHENPELLKP